MDFGGFAPGHAAAGSEPGTQQAWDRTESLGFIDGPGVATEDTIALGFGFEGISDPAARNEAMGNVLRYFGLIGDAARRRRRRRWRNERWRRTAVAPVATPIRPRPRSPTGRQALGEEQGEVQVPLRRGELELRVQAQGAGREAQAEELA